MNLIRNGQAKGQFDTGYAEGAEYASHSSGVNKFLLLTIDPMNATAAPVPAPDLTPTITKSIVSPTTILTTADDASILLTYAPYSLITQSRLIMWRKNINGKFAPFKALTPSEAIKDDFVRGNLVASGLAVYSATQPGGTLNLSGSINAAWTVVPPDVTSVTHDTVIVYAGEDRMRIAAQPILDGIVACTPTWGEYVPEEIETGDVYNKSQIIDVSTSNFKNFVATAGLSNGWTAQYFDSLNTTFVPPNVFGRYIFQFDVDSNYSIAGNVSIPLDIVLTFETPDGDTAITYTINASKFISGAATTLSGHFELKVNAYEDYVGGAAFTPAMGVLKRVQINWNPVANYFGDAAVYARARIISPTGFGYRSPMLITSLAGLQTAMQLNVLTREVYELLPNQQLIRNLKVSDEGDWHIDDLMVAKMIHALAKGEFKFIYKRSEYTFLSNSKVFLNLAVRGQNNLPVGQALGLPMWLKSIMSGVKVIPQALRKTANIMDYASNEFSSFN